MTATELRMVEEYVWTLDYVSRCALGVDRGDWFYLADKASELATSAQRLRDIAHDAYRAYTQGHGPRPEVVGVAVASQGRHYRAGRLLHPGPKGRR